MKFSELKSAAHFLHNNMPFVKVNQDTYAHRALNLLTGILFVFLDSEECELALPLLETSRGDIYGDCYGVLSEEIPEDEEYEDEMETQTPNDTDIVPPDEEHASHETPVGYDTLAFARIEYKQVKKCECTHSFLEKGCTCGAMS